MSYLALEVHAGKWSLLTARHFETPNGARRRCRDHTAKYGPKTGVARLLEDGRMEMPDETGMVYTTDMFPNL